MARQADSFHEVDLPTLSMLTLEARTEIQNIKGESE